MKLSDITRGITRYWWLPLLTGLLSIGIGIWCLCSPVTSLPVLAYAFSICILAAGLCNLIFAFVNTGGLPGWGWALAYGIIEILCGVWLLTLPAAVMTTAFIYAIGIYLVFVAVNSICEACMLNSYGSIWFGLILALLLATIVFSIIFLAGPVVGDVAVWLYIGISFICFGIYRMVLSAGLRRINKAVTSRA